VLLRRPPWKRKPPSYCGSLADRGGLVSRAVSPPPVATGTIGWFFRYPGRFSQGFQPPKFFGLSATQVFRAFRLLGLSKISAPLLRSLRAPQEGKEGPALQPRDDFGMSHGLTGNGGHRFWWKSEGRGSVG
jgi:hypothetical protein